MNSASPTTDIPYVPPTGDLFFPLASNAQALLAGSGVAGVRSRMKIGSLLYNRILLEAGSMSIHAGLDGTASFREPYQPGPFNKWQTLQDRHKEQANPFTITAAPETSPGIPSTSPQTAILHSKTSISWRPTFYPFRAELPRGCDWIAFGNAKGRAPVFGQIADRWKRYDDNNKALKRLVPEDFVRSTLVDHVSDDLVTGTSGGWEVSVDRLHGQVIGARFANDAIFEPHGFALPILIPDVGDLTWEDIAKIRRKKALERLREVLRELEAEAVYVAKTGGDLEATILKTYNSKVTAAITEVTSIRSAASTFALELIVGIGAGYATFGLAGLAPLAGAGLGAAITTGLHFSHDRRKQSWVSVMGMINDAVPNPWKL